MNRPRVVVVAIASVDGRLTLAPDVLLLFGEKRWQALGAGEDVNEWLKHVHKPQANLEGSGSFVPNGQVPKPLPSVAGDPESLYQDYLPDEVLHRPGHQGWFTVVDGRGRVRWRTTEEEGWHLLVLVARHTPPEYLAYLQRGKVPYLVAGDQRVDLELALEKLGSRLDVTCVLSTAGGKLNGALLRAGLVDEINIVFFPAVIGGFETPSLFDSPALKPDEWPTRLKLISCQVQAEGRVWLRGQVIRE